MPDASGNDEGLARREMNFSLWISVLQENGDPSGEKEEQLVAVWMHLAVMRWFTGHEGRSNRVAVDPRRGTGWNRDDRRLPIPMESDHAFA